MLDLIRIVKYISMIGMGLILNACLGSAPSSNTSGFSDLSITGQIIDTTGAAPTQAFIFVEGLRQAVPFIANSGSFQIQLNDTQLNQIRSNLGSMRPYFYLYAESASGASGTKGKSGKVFFSKRGTIQNLQIQLKETMQFLGYVKTSTADGNPQPVANAIVTAGAWRAVSDINGQFIFDALPKGVVSFVVAAQRMERQIAEIDIENDDRTIWLFPSIGITGILSSNISRAENPYQINFDIDASSEARYFRVSPDPLAFGNDFAPGEDLNTIAQKNPNETSVDGVPSGQKAPWLTIQEMTSYQFEGFGRYRLYYQFSDATKQRFSPVYFTEISLTNLDGEYGAIPANRSPIQLDSSVNFEVIMPQTAMMMRYADIEIGLKDAEWRPARDNFQFNFRDVTPLSERRELFIQFMDSYGKISPSYSSIVDLNLFPLSHYGVTGNNGSNIITDTTTDLIFDIPENAVSMRYIVEDGINNVFTQLNFELLPFLGIHPILREGLNPNFSVNTYPIYVQYIDKNGNMSRVYRSDIIVDNCLDGFGMFAATPPFFNFPESINTQTLTSSSFIMGAAIPPGAIEMIVFEEGKEELADWQQVLPFSDFTISGDGENFDPNRTYYVKYRDLNGFQSCAYKRIFQLELFTQASPPMVLEFDQAPLNVPTNLLINPPFNAREMQITFASAVDFPPVTLESGWIAIDGNYSFISDTLGVQNVNIRFRDENNNVSEAFNISYETVDPSVYGNYGLFIAEEDANEIINAQTNFGVLAPADAIEMLIYEEGQIDSASWEAAASSKVLTITGDGDNYEAFKTFFVKFRDQSSVETAAYKRTFKLSIFPSSWSEQLENDNTFIAESEGNFTINAPANTDKIYVELEIADENGEILGGKNAQWQDLNTNYSFTAPIAGEYNYTVKFKDENDNVSKSYSSVLTATEEEEEEEEEEE